MMKNSGDHDGLRLCNGGHVRYVTVAHGWAFYYYNVDGIFIRSILHTSVIAAKL